MIVNIIISTCNKYNKIIEHSFLYKSLKFGMCNILLWTNYIQVLNSHMSLDTGDVEERL